MLFWTLTALASLATALPAGLTRRDISSDTLDELMLFAQYSAASYCSNNIDSSASTLSCAAGNCPEVQTANAAPLYAFDDSTQYGDVAGFLAADDTNKLLVLSFRGSRTLSTWIANLNFDLSNSTLCSGCEVHTGFWKSWDTVSAKLKSEIDSAMKKYPGYTLVLTGHSFGAALAVLGGTALRNAGYKPNLYTYGEPRVGNTALATYITNQGSLWRVTHTDDIVPKLPPASFGFSQPSPEYWITSGDNVTVTTSTVQVIQGVGSDSGNAGTSDTSIEAHNWYLVDIDACQ
ncbi:hypothetical protein N7474_000068 [Penicillium riverlandense]|uniref:uncharacterized protein n=1 Tax=Penicillium riverlandense TaxID=1903569 RepID=UPI0025474A5D|nr:uncharacterized protein N7474_000068 [Penicillium riverlandense]KAJ5831757.1 hypothetical protein N7474_000068 [Penicillium riverlandense]